MNFKLQQNYFHFHKDGSNNEDEEEDEDEDEDESRKGKHGGLFSQFEFLLKQTQKHDLTPEFPLALKELAGL